ncbi:heme peroxidase [Cynara cardunculus var. scolymus]|uniref:peroxidase n=1 Tax=Cynara cardunculus var. scolymus TaxID=59895 RepID=A0A103Y633_CYNCS|nr:heme peroxidase [Cynara cardunculus var. scolymus]
MASSTTSFFFKFFTFTLSLWALFGSSSGQLSANFYARTCPNFRSIITRAVNSAGCDASVLLDDTANLLVKKLRLRGPRWNVVFGRRDSTTASLSAANSNLPSPDSSLSALISSFSNQGSHSIGQARCTTFRNRLNNDNNINSTFATSLRANCPTSGGDNNLAPLDASPASFDNRYFNDLQIQRGLLHSDQELFNGGSTDAQVIDTIKTQLERQCRAWWAKMQPHFGRRDSTTASSSAASSNPPSPISSLSALISSFSNLGFTANEMVALSSE